MKDYNTNMMLLLMESHAILEVKEVFVKKKRNEVLEKIKINK